MYRSLILLAFFVLSPKAVADIWQVELPQEVRALLDGNKKMSIIDMKSFQSESLSSIKLAARLIEKTGSDQVNLGFSLKEVCGESYVGGSCVLGHRAISGHFSNKIRTGDAAAQYLPLINWIEKICHSGCSEYELQLDVRTKATIYFTSSLDQAILVYHLL